MALRTSLLQATWNYERQQGLGWAWALKPALERLYPDAAERTRRLAEHTGYFNTQPTLASIALGAAANLEERRAAGEPIDADSLSHMKGVLGSSLAALGDRLFWFTLRPFAACLGIWLVLDGSVHWLGALALVLAYNVVHQSVRWVGVRWGYRDGPAAWSDPLRKRFQRLIRVLAAGGAVLVGVLVASLMVPPGGAGTLGAQVRLALGLGVGLVTAQRSRPSPTVLAIAIGVAAVASQWFR